MANRTLAKMLLSVLLVVADSRKPSADTSVALETRLATAQTGPWASRTVVHLRASGNPSALAAALGRKVNDLGKLLPSPTCALFRRSWNAHCCVSGSLERLRPCLVRLALLLAAIALYGLVAPMVARRTREFVIRIAVGGKAGNGRLVVGEAPWPLIGGTTVGLAAAWALGRVVRRMLFGIESGGPLPAVVAVLFWPRQRWLQPAYQRAVPRASIRWRD
jgi:hypothetical protein